MATRQKKAKTAAKRRPSRPGRAKRRLQTAGRERGLSAAGIALSLDDPEVSEVVALIRTSDGTALGGYRDPLGGRALVLATLPVRALQPTPFQRDLSPTHTKRLAQSIEQAGAFLDPLVVVVGHDGRFWTPNGRHRLAAAKVLGLRQITVLISPDDALAYRILALNTEKAHNLKDRSLEVIRMARSLARRDASAREAQYAEHFEAAELLTLGMVYEDTPRFAGGAYSPMLRKVDRFSSRTLSISLRDRKGYASRLLAIDDQVKKLIGALQARGFKSPYLRNYVVARLNPVRFHIQKRGETRPAMPIGEALTRMTAAARNFKIESVSSGDLAWVAVGAGAQD